MSEQHTFDYFQKQAREQKLWQNQTTVFTYTMSRSCIKNNLKFYPKFIKNMQIETAFPTGAQLTITISVKLNHYNSTVKNNSEKFEWNVSLIRDVR